MIRQQVLALSLVFGMTVQCCAALSAETFVYGFEDLPLMDGLTQRAQNSVLFDTPQGRIVQASAVGETTPELVIAFYDQTLPQLGWTRVAEGQYQREGERLRFEFTASNGQLFVTFLAEPSSN